MPRLPHAGPPPTPSAPRPEPRCFLDKASIFGIVVGTGLVVSAIALGGSLATFVNIQGFLIVAGGTVAATSIAFPTRELKSIWKVTRRVFNDPGDEMLAISRYMAEALRVLKKEGPIALERLAEEAPTDPLRKGILLLADGTDSATLREILGTERKYMEEHHRVGQKIFTEMGKYAPAFGMVGTLIGLVQMLAGLSDPDTIGPAMAVALLTTFYGAVLANLVFIPMVSKLDRRIHIEVTQVQFAIVGLTSMNQGDTMAIFKEKVLAFLNQREGVAEAAFEKAA